MRQSTAQSRHQLLPACGACGACEWCVSAGRRCSGCGLSSSAYGPRPSTQTRPFSSVSALVAAAFGPAVGSAVAMSRERHAVAQLATGGSCIDATPTPVGMAWPLHPLTNSSSGCHRMARTAGLRCHGRLACVEAVSAAVDSPVTSSAPPRMWCMRRMQMVRISRPSRATPVVA